jgi:arginine deiminase
MADLKDQGFGSYGTEHFGRLKKVLLHAPINSIGIINESNREHFLFDSVPDAGKYLDEHRRYSDLLRSLGVEVFELADYVVESRELMGRLPNLAYLHDIAVVSSRGAILSRMCPGGREHEEVVVGEALSNMGIPFFHKFNEGERFEGMLLLSPDTALIADTERHDPGSIERFFPKALQLFNEIIYIEIPQARRFMHPDMVFNRISAQLALVYKPAFLHTWLVTADSCHEIDFEAYMKGRRMELVCISDEEQQRWGCSFVPLEPNIIIHYDIALNNHTRSILSGYGVQIIDFHPEALLAGGGSLRCLTLRLYRE